MDLADSYQSLVRIYGKLEDDQKAIEYGSKVLNIRRIRLGEPHVKTADSYYILAELFEAIGEYQRALRYYGKSVDIYRFLMRREYDENLEKGIEIVKSDMNRCQSNLVKNFRS